MPTIARIDRRQLLAERFAGRTSFEHGNHQLAAPGADRIDGEERVARLRAARRLRLQDQQLRALELRPLLRRHDFADHARQNHVVRLEPTLIVDQ